MAGAMASRGSNCSIQVTVEQQWVGWLLGKGGAAVRDLEASTGAKISFNQESKDHGFSTINMSGAPGQILAAYDSMTESLKRAGGVLGELPHWITSMQPGRKAPLPVLPRGGGGCAGGCGGCGGGSAPDLSQAMVVIARAFVEESGPDGLRRVLPLLQDLLASRPDLMATLTRISQSSGGSAKGGKGRAAAAARERSRSPHRAEVKVEQHLVGWLVGGKGRTVQQIEEETGASIHIDQSTKDAGYSVVHVSGNLSAVQHAEKRIQGSLAIFNKEPGSDNIEMQVEQRLVGWILGKSGTVLREIESQSGAWVAIDQATKELGFSTVRISGDALECQAAKQLIEVKIKEATARQGDGLGFRP